MMAKETPTSEPTPIVAGTLQPGMVIDFLTGKAVRDTPEEYVRQNIEKALVRQYRYKDADCLPEFSIKMGSSKKRVDIVVFEPNKPKSQATAYLLVETKKPGTSPQNKTDGIEQLKSYMAACPNVLYGMWTNGDDKLCVSKTVVGGKVTFDETCPDIPAFGQTEAEAARPKRRDLVPATADNLLFAFRRCHNYIAGTEGMHKTEAFWELLKVIFCKIEDERSKEIEFFVTPSELSSGTGGAPAKKRLQKIFAEKVVQKYETIFEESDRIIKLEAKVTAFVISQLQRYSLLASPVDVKGVAYEEIVGSNLRGDRGEFFTPRNACRMAVNLVKPQPTERLLDPCCGTGGFLITAMNFALRVLDEEQKALWRDSEQPTEVERQELYRRRSTYLAHHVRGLDLNPALVRAAKMNMVMNNDGEGGLFQANSLANPHSWSAGARSGVPLGSIDVIFTNPPFGANIVIDDAEVLDQYELACVWDKDEGGKYKKRLDKSGRPQLQKSLPPEILFVERCFQFLKPGTGRMAMVIPNGILNNPALEYVRQWILTRLQIIAVVDMARDLFQPKNDTQTSMVVFRRLSHDEATKAEEKGLDYPVFMAVAETIGHDKRGNTIYKRSPDGKELIVSRNERISEIDPTTNLPVVRETTVYDRVVDDELPEVVVAFENWLKEVA